MDQHEPGGRVIKLASPNGFFWERDGATVRWTKLPFAVAEDRTLALPPGIPRSTWAEQHPITEAAVSFRS
ncbi:hypothetical protein AB0F72_08985 [Actinoplanes sp. NPDC023936]|uniref:hypothetical protein n=1 Tax=Actinoplanes sp. NPDC023936 TaxID=3154910 RepID=UPI0033CC23F3